MEEGKGFDLNQVFFFSYSLFASLRSGLYFRDNCCNQCFQRVFQRKETTVSLRCPGPHHLNLEASYQNNLLNREVQFLKLTVHKAINIHFSHNPEAPLFPSGSQDKRNLRAS